MSDDSLKEFQENLMIWLDDIKDHASALEDEYIYYRNAENVDEEALIKRVNAHIEKLQKLKGRIKVE